MIRRIDCRTQATQFLQALHTALVPVLGGGDLHLGHGRKDRRAPVVPAVEEVVVLALRVDCFDG